MRYLSATLLGVLQGITEFLPVSSTAHLLIAGRLLGFEDPGGAFTVMIQLGSILAVVWLYRRRLLDVIVRLPTSPDARRFAIVMLVAVLPAFAAGTLLSDFIKTVLFASTVVFAAAFVIGGIVMLVVERFRPAPRVEQAERTTFGRAVGIGICQTLALVPGVSRSGATIVGGMVMGLDRAAAAEFSFFLAIPTMTAAFAHDLMEVHSHLAPDRALEIAIGFLTAFASSAFVIKPFLGYVARAGFAPFAWYRIAAGIVLFAALAAGWF